MNRATSETGTSAVQNDNTTIFLSSQERTSLYSDSFFKTITESVEKSIV